MEVMTTRRKFVAVFTVCLYAIAARTEAKPLQADLSSLSSQELQYYFGRNSGVPEYRLLNTHHLRRERRSTDDSSTLRYKLDAFDESFQLLLQQTQNLFNAGTLIHRIGASGVPRISSPEKHCYFTGESENHANSRVYLSTCNGLIGTIIIDSAEYVIQPLKDEHIDSENNLAPNHIIFKKPSIGSSSSCSNHEERPTEDTTNERRRRDVTDEPKYIETSVVVDDEMHDTYGDLTENYVLSILNQVSGLFQDTGLDSNIVLHINKITIIEEPQNNLDVTEELDHSLTNFCDWQKAEKSDVSLLITKRDLESAGNTAVTGKAADVGGACNPDKRCVITEDHGPSGLVFTIAHEIGHSLGMYHDGGFTDCPNRKNIMASVNSGGSDAFRWSQCSNMDLTNFLRTPESSCLDNTPLEMPEYNALTTPMAGYYINATRQCQMTFGPKATASVKYVGTEDMCSTLRCDLGEWAKEVTNDIPPLDGTSCGKSHRDVCMRGSCMKVYSTLDCDGGPCIPQWLEGAWEACVNCVQQRTVLCVEIHTDDGTTRLANEDTCPVDKPAEERNCCTVETFQYVIGDWGDCVGVCDTGVEERTVVCQETLTGNTVADSMCTGVKPATQQSCPLTPCTPTTDFSYSIGAFSACPVTCGTGIQTRTVNCININNIVVATSNCVNAGLGTVPTTQACETGVTCPTADTYRYVTGPLSACSVTCGTGTQTRIVMCMNQNNVVVASSFCSNQGLVAPSTTISCTMTACEVVSTYRYVSGGFGACSVTCGEGFQTRSVTCVNENSQVVTDAFCDTAGLVKPSTTQTCTLNACPSSLYVFVTGNYGPCSVTCGTGIRTRSVFCVNENSLSFPFSFCLDAGLEEPAMTTVCTEDPCPGQIVYRYVVGELSVCSTTCGDGLQTRSVTCLDNNNQLVAESNCVAAGLVRPDSSIMCFLQDCANYSYFAGEFSPCPVTCGGGVQVRVVECRNEETMVAVDKAFCTDEEPSAVLNCALNDCDVIYEYVVGPYGTCSCEGQQTRIVFCVERSGTSLTRVDDSTCVGAGLSRPTSSQACDPPTSCAGPTWATTDFGACSVTCGLGVQSRLVYCVEAPNSQVIVDNSLCVPDLEPEATRVCDTQTECPNQYIWLFSEWGQCSVTCGEGVETRSVTCYSLADAVVTEVDPSLCPADQEPAAVQECTRPPCNGIWQATLWSVCSQSCGCGGTRTRTVSCYTFKGSGVLANETECIAEDRPDDSEDCFLIDCPAPYGCEQTYEVNIGTSYQLISPNYPNAYPNDIVCDRDYAATAGLVDRRKRRQADLGYHVEITFTDFDVEFSPNCQYDFLEILDIQGTNSVKLCGTLDPLPYTYRSTGPEVRVRFVSDASNNGRGFAATYELVPNQGAYYVPGEFGECSATCGGGLQTRSIECYLNDERVDDAECASLDRPAETQPCNLGVCPTVDACLAEVLRTEEGMLSSPNFPSNYTNNATCVNRIRAPLGKVVEITAQFFSLQDSTACSADALVFDDVNAAVAPTRVCGAQTPASVLFTSLTNEMLVTFVTDESVVDSGFSVSYNFVDATLDLDGGFVQTNGQPIYSPGYPGNYSNDVNSQLSIITPDGCVELVFLSVSLEDDPACNDKIIVDDQNSDVVDLTLCGTPDTLPRVWYSASNFVRVTFESNADTVNQGYLAAVQFADCYVGTWDLGDWQECSVTCGEGEETRTVVCRHAITDVVINESQCPEDKPASSRPCRLAECPSCDRRVTSSDVLNYPGNMMNYGNNEDCVTTIFNDNGCISLVFLDIDIQPGTTSSYCDRDYVEVIDESNSALSFRVCGTNRPPNFQSISNTVSLRFVSDELVTASGYNIFLNFGTCPTYYFIPGNYSECDVTCGLGTRTREVNCIALQSGNIVDDALCTGDKPRNVTACQLEECPSCDVFYDTDNQLVANEDYGGNYSANQDCTYTFNNTDTGSETCIRLQFLVLDLEPANDLGICEDDYLEVVDLENPTLTTRYCGTDSNPPEWLSRSRSVEVKFHTDDEGTGSGFNVYQSYATCSPFGFSVGPFSECDVTCGGGMRTRAVQCVTLQTGALVTEELCSDPKPLESEPCGEGECPSCDAQVESQVIFNSPNYPMNYDNLLDCEYSIYNPDGCVSLLFLVIDLELPNPLDNLCRDYVEIEDESTDILTRRFCGNELPPVWRSRSGNVSVTFYSDGQNVEQGFSLYPQYVTCPAFGYVTQDFGECSVTCGEGVRLRQVNCLNLATEMVVLDSQCTDTKPPNSEPCVLDMCPICDEVVNTTNSLVNSPNYPMDYENNQQCLYAVDSLDVNECVRLFFTVFELPEEEDGVCSDYVWIEEEVDGYTRDARFCGTRTPFPYEALSSQVNVTFVTDDEETETGFQMYVAFQNCPDFGYVATEFGECSVTCGEGTQTRTVSCYDTTNDMEVAEANCAGQEPLATERACVLPECPLCYFPIDTNGELISSPGFPADYLHNQDCIYNITNPADNGCISLNVLYFELTPRVMGACLDYLTIDDVNDNDPEPQQFCNDEAPMMWTSQSNNVVLNFRSDATGTNGGFTIVANFQQCPDPPPFVYELGEYGECDVTCGVGTQTRTVQCVQRGTTTVVPDNLCVQPAPPTERPCSEEPCPSCDQTITTDMSFVASPNSPLNYENNQNCVYNITNVEGDCINLIFISFVLEDGTNDTVCDNDYLRIEDANVDSVTRTHCGVQTLPEWKSRTSTALLTFRSNDAVVAPGFNIYATFTDCPIFGFVATEWSMCDRGCGGGTQTRTVECQRLETMDVVADDVCSDARPATTQLCNTEPCPSCDQTIDTDKYTLMSPDSPGSYGPNYDCEYTYTNPGGQNACMVLFFLSFELPPPNQYGVCDQDYLLVEDLSNNPVSFTYCGDSTPMQFTTRSNVARVTFHSDNNEAVLYDGFSIYSSFSPSCPLFGFTVGEYGPCDRDCDGGMQTRAVQCVLFSTGQIVAENTCTDQKPAESRACNTDPCPSCDETITTTAQIIQSPNYPAAYNPDRTCTYTINNPSDCVRLQVLNFNVPQGADAMMCTTDFVKIADLGVDYLNETLCGSIANLYVWESRTSDVEVTLQTGSMVPAGANFQIYVNFEECPENGWVAGPFGACSQTCGFGTRTRTVECQNLMTNAVVSDTLCEGNLPPLTEVCEDDACPSCDEAYTSGGVITSLDPYGPNRRCVYSVTNTAPNGCVNILTLGRDLDLPNVNGTCDVTSLTFEDNNNPGLSQTSCGVANTGSWLSTSGSVQVVFETGSTANQTGDMGWSVFTQFVTCANFGFMAGPWQMCSASCEGGTQIRDVQCVNMDNNMLVDEVYCSGVKPATSRDCNTGACPQECGLVFTPDSSENTVQSPGFGYNYTNDQDCTNTVVNPTGCIVFTFLDLSIQAGSTPLVCDNDYVELIDANFNEYNMRYCGADTPASSWRSQGPLARVQFVSDGSVVDEGFNIFYTFTSNCPTAEYMTGAWSACSDTCGGGVQVRAVTCRDMSNNVVADSNCPGTMPAVSQVCNLISCADFVTGPWSNCSLECGGGNQTRSVTCEMDGMVVDEAMCTQIKPAEVQDCNVDPCPQLSVGNWSACSVTCGVGQETRVVECTIGSTVVDISMCGMDAVDTNTTQECTLQQCPTFVTEAWTECPATCGFSNMQTRNVTCQNDVTDFSDSACNETKPAEAQLCNERSCLILCGDTVTSSTTLTNFTIPSPFTGNYSDTENCTIDFFLEPGFIAQLTFTSIDVAFAANPAECALFDYIDTSSNPVCSTGDATTLSSNFDNANNSTYSFTFYTNNDGDTGAGMEVDFTLINTAG